MKKVLKDENLSKVTGGSGSGEENTSEYICPACNNISNYNNIKKRGLGSIWICPIDTCGKTNLYNKWKEVK